MSYTADAYYRAEHDESPVVLCSGTDVDALIDGVISGDLAHSVVALYVNERPKLDGGFPDHELRLGIFAEGKTGSVRYTQGMQSWYLGGQASRRAEGAVYSYMHHREGFPMDSEVDLDVLRRIAQDFLALGGERPPGQWLEWPPRQD